MRDLAAAVLAVDAAARPYLDRRGDNPRRETLRDAVRDLHVVAAERYLYDRVHGLPAESVDPQTAFEALLKAAFHAGLPWPEIVATVNRLAQLGDAR